MFRTLRACLRDVVSSSDWCQRSQRELGRTNLSLLCRPSVGVDGEGSDRWLQLQYLYQFISFAGASACGTQSHMSSTRIELSAFFARKT